MERKRIYFSGKKLCSCDDKSPHEPHLHKNGYCSGVMGEVCDSRRRKKIMLVILPTVQDVGVIAFDVEYYVKPLITRENIVSLLRAAGYKAQGNRKWVTVNDGESTYFLDTPSAIEMYSGKIRESMLDNGCAALFEAVRKERNGG